MDTFQDDFAHGAYLVWGQAALGSGTTGTPSTAAGGGVLKFDIVQDEEVDRDADIVTHPVEQGADVADHYRIKPNHIKLEAFISQEPLDGTIYGPGNASVLLPVALALPSYPPGNPFLAFFNPLGAAVRAIDQLLQGPPLQSFQAWQFVQSFDALANVLGVIDMLRADATIVDVATRSAYYPNMLIGKVTTKRNADTGTGTAISLEVHQVRFATTQTVGVPPLPAKPKDAPPVSKGVQNPTPPNSSLAYNLLFGP